MPMNVIKYLFLKMQYLETLPAYVCVILHLAIALGSVQIHCAI